MWAWAYEGQEEDYGGLDQNVFHFTEYIVPSEWLCAGRFRSYDLASGSRDMVLGFNVTWHPFLTLCFAIAIQDGIPQLPAHPSLTQPS